MVGLEAKKSTQMKDLTSESTLLLIRGDELVAEKNHLTKQLKELEKDNDSLKTKFSCLLDQFQDYVTSNEHESELKAQVLKDETLAHMTEQIRELEKITESLQFELESKEKIFEEMTCLLYTSDAADE